MPIGSAVNAMFACRWLRLPATEHYWPTMNAEADLFHDCRGLSPCRKDTDSGKNRDNPPWWQHVTCTKAGCPFVPMPSSVIWPRVQRRSLRPPPEARPSLRGCATCCAPPSRSNLASKQQRQLHHRVATTCPADKHVD